MRRVTRWFKDFFTPDNFNNLDIDAIGQAFNDLGVRTLWLQTMFSTLRDINMEVDKRLLSGSELGLLDLCARRKAYQDMLELVLSARRQVMAGTQDVRHNPRVGVEVNLDRVTA